MTQKEEGREEKRSFYYKTLLIGCHDLFNAMNHRPPAVKRILFFSDKKQKTREAILDLSNSRPHSQCKVDGSASRSYFVVVSYLLSLRVSE